jgi:nucleotidyltransferase/DNA polymerase involved in DNA repair
VETGVFNTLRRMLWMIGPRSFLACFHMRADYNRLMATIAEIEKLAQDLSENDRAVLAAHLLESLPPVLHDDDEGIGEALRRDAELETNPSASLTIEQLDQRIERRRS